jgi:hypothetical protein
MSVLGPHTITVLRAPRVAGDYGTATVPDWDNATSVDVTGCSVQPAPAPEYVVDRSQALTRWQVFAPSTADVRPTDRIGWGSTTYDVDGDPQRWDFPPLSHLVINLVRSEDS